MMNRQNARTLKDLSSVPVGLVSLALVYSVKVCICRQAQEAKYNNNNNYVNGSSRKTRPGCSIDA